MHIQSSRQYGFTLIELAIALAIVAILATIGTQSFASVLHAARASSAGSSLLESLTLARSAAASHEVDVVLCPSSDGTSCTAGFHWESGWIAFADIHEDGERSADEPIVHVQAALGAKVHLITSSGRTRIRFQPNGGNAGSNATFTLCDGRGPTRATAFVMANSGNLHGATPKAETVTEACRE